MRTGFKQQNAYLSLATPLGADKLLLTALRGTEGVSEPFAFDLEMISEDATIDFSKIVGKSVTVTLALEGGNKRYLSGVVARFSQVGGDPGFASYRAQLVPWLWWLTLQSDSRIFQAKSAPDIVTGLFDELGLRDYRSALSGSYAAREYCVQYRESTFDFVSRLLEEEGIYYYFEHESGKHTMVLADDSSAATDCPHRAGARFGAPGNARELLDVVFRLESEQRAVSAKYATDDYNFETPSAELLATAEGKADRMEVFDYPGGYAAKGDGDARAKLRLQALQHEARAVRGESYCRAFTPGFKFALSGHPRPDTNASYVLRRVSHDASHDSYSNSFEAFPATLPFRPPRLTPRPRIEGAQTALVTGKSGEEIWTDKYGRIKVLFHWDRKGKKDETSSCWVRVAQGWTGKGWGAMFLPRIGQEVVVSFLEGDPDRPLVTGSVYNAEQTVPYGLPGEQTKSTVKSNTSKGGGGANEIRFEDKKDAEEIYVHAQKDMNTKVENDRATTVLKGNDTLVVEKGGRSVTVKKGAETLAVDEGNRTVEVKKGDETHKVAGERSVSVTKKEKHVNSADYGQQVSGKFELKVTGDLLIDVTGSITIKSAQSVTTQAGTSLLSKAGTSLTSQAGTSLENKAGTTMTNEAGISLTNKGSASQTVEGGGMLTLKGGMVKVN